MERLTGIRACLRVPRGGVRACYDARVSRYQYTHADTSIPFNHVPLPTSKPMKRYACIIGVCGSSIPTVPRRGGGGRGRDAVQGGRPRGGVQGPAARATRKYTHKTAISKKHNMARRAGRGGGARLGAGASATRHGTIRWSAHESARCDHAVVSHNLKVQKFKVRIPGSRRSPPRLTSRHPQSPY